MNELINKKEQIGRKCFNDLARCNPNITWHTFEVNWDSPNDVRFYSSHTACIAEIKYRPDKTNEYFKNNGAFLEQTKLNGLIRRQKEIEESSGFKPDMYYVNFTANGAMIYHLKDNASYTFKTRLLPKDNQNIDLKIYKQVAELYNPVQVYTLERKYNE